MAPRQVLSLECAENVAVEKSCSRVFFRPLLDFLLRREPAWFGSARNSPINALSPDKTFLVGEPLVPVRGTKTVLIERNGHRFGLILDSPGAVVVLACQDCLGQSVVGSVVDLLQRFSLCASASASSLETKSAAGHVRFAHRGCSTAAGALSGLCRVFVPGKVRFQPVIQVGELVDVGCYETESNSSSPLTSWLEGCWSLQLERDRRSVANLWCSNAVLVVSFASNDGGWDGVSAERITWIMSSEGLFEVGELSGAREVVDLSEFTSDFREVGGPKFQPQVEAPEGRIFQGDSIEWLKSVDSSSVDLVFADPPYNLKKADWDSFESQEAYVAWSLEWIAEASRVLKEDGSLYVCGFSEIIADVKLPAMQYFAHCRWLIWHYKNKANLGNDWGRSHESILHFRKSKKQKLANVDYLRIPYGAHTLKYPSHSQAETSAYGGGRKKRDDWTPHPMGAKVKDVITVPTTCNGMNEKTPHPTQKPEELVRKFVWASSSPGGVVLDPFSGSGTTAVVAAQLGRKFLACDMNAEYNSWAAQRLRLVPQNRTESDWFEYDRRNMQRRESIR